MASYLTGVTDYIPQVQPFHPDLNFYAYTLQTKDSQYRQGEQKLSGIYGSLLNSPMLRQADNDQRDKFFKDAQNSIQKMSESDLSLPQNVEQAYQVFQPLIKNQNITNDMAKTRSYINANQYGEQLRNCQQSKTNPCREQYWDGGKQLLDYWRKDFQDASDDEALGFRDPKFTPKIDIGPEAQNWLMKNKIKSKNSGLTTRPNATGGYDVYNAEYTNSGYNSVLALHDLLKTQFEGDSKVQEYYQALAQLHRRNSIEASLPQYNGDKNAAADAYDRDITNEIQGYQKHTGERLVQASNLVEAKKQNLLNQVSKTGPIDSNDALYKLALDNIKDGIFTNTALDQHSANVSAIDPSRMLSADRENRGRNLDQAYGSYLMSNHLYQAASNYARSTAETKLTTNPYYMNYLKLKDKMTEMGYGEQLKEQYLDKKMGMSAGQPLPNKGWFFDAPQNTKGSAAKIPGLTMEQAPLQQVHNIYVGKSEKFTKNLMEDLITKRDQGTSDESTLASNYLKQYFGIKPGDNPDYDNKIPVYYPSAKSLMDNVEFQHHFADVYTDRTGDLINAGTAEMGDKADNKLAKQNQQNLFGYLNDPKNAALSTPSERAGMANLFDSNGILLPEDNARRKAVDPDGKYMRALIAHYNAGYKDAQGKPLLKPLSQDLGIEAGGYTTTAHGYIDPHAANEQNPVLIHTYQSLGSGAYTGIVGSYDAADTKTMQPQGFKSPDNATPDYAKAVQLLTEEFASETHTKPSKNDISTNAIVSPKLIVTGDASNSGVSIMFPEKFLNKYFPDKKSVSPLLPGHKRDYENGVTVVYNTKDSKTPPPPEIFDRFNAKPVKQALIVDGIVTANLPGASALKIVARKDANGNITKYDVSGHVLLPDERTGRLTPTTFDNVDLPATYDMDGVYDLFAQRSREVAKYNQTMGNSPNNPQKANKPIHTADELMQAISRDPSLAPAMTGGNASRYAATAPEEQDESGNDDEGTE